MSDYLDTRTTTAWVGACGGGGGGGGGGGWVGAGVSFTWWQCSGGLELVTKLHPQLERKKIILKNLVVVCTV